MFMDIICVTITVQRKEEECSWRRKKEWKYVGVKFLYTNEIKFILIWTKLLEVKMLIAIPRPIPKLTSPEETIVKNDPAK